MSAVIATESATRNGRAKGARTYEYADFGRTVRSKVYADLALNEISDVQADTPSAGVTTITLSGPGFDLDELAGREVYVGGASASGHVLANGGSVIYVRDTADALATAMNPSSTVVRGCAVLDFREKPETDYSFIFSDADMRAWVCNAFSILFTMESRVFSHVVKWSPHPTCVLCGVVQCSLL